MLDLAPMPLHGLCLSGISEGQSHISMVCFVAWEKKHKHVNKYMFGR